MSLILNYMIVVVGTPVEMLVCRGGETCGINARARFSAGASFVEGAFMTPEYIQQKTVSLLIQI
jgi:hypothetical protein